MKGTLNQEGYAAEFVRRRPNALVGTHKQPDNAVTITSDVDGKLAIDVDLYVAEHVRETLHFSTKPAKDALDTYSLGTFTSMEGREYSCDLNVFRFKGDYKLFASATAPGKKCFGDRTAFSRK